MSKPRKAKGEKKMTREEKQNWLENAKAEELMMHYNSINAAQAKVGTPIDEWCKLQEDKLMAEAEIMERLLYAEACQKEEIAIAADEAITRNAY